MVAGAAWGTAQWHEVCKGRTGTGLDDSAVGIGLGISLHASAFTRASHGHHLATHGPVREQAMPLADLHAAPKLRPG